MCRSTGFHSVRRFRLRGKCPSDRTSRFRKPPVSSRTVGFPESGWRPWLFPIGSSLELPKLKRRLVYTPGSSGLPNSSTYHGGDQLTRNGVLGCSAFVPAKAESLFACSEVLPACSVISGTTSEGITPPSSLILAHAPNQIPPSDFVILFQRVLAGCRQPLLGDGPSRRYLRNPYIGAWTPTPWCPSGAFTRFFPEDIGLTLPNRRSTHQIFPAMQLQQGADSRLQSFSNVQAPILARPPDCTYRYGSQHGGFGCFSHPSN